MFREMVVVSSFVVYVFGQNVIKTTMAMLTPLRSCKALRGQISILVSLRDHERWTE